MVYTYSHSISTLLGQSSNFQSRTIATVLPQVSRYFLSKANPGAKDNLDVMASNICGAAASVLTASWLQSNWCRWRCLHRENGPHFFIEHSGNMASMFKKRTQRKVVFPEERTNNGGLSRWESHWPSWVSIKLRLITEGYMFGWDSISSTTCQSRTHEPSFSKVRGIATPKW